MGMWDSIAGLFTGGINKTIDSIGDAIDKNVTTDQERLALRNALEQIKATAIKDAQDYKLKIDEIEQRSFESTVKDRESARLRDVELAKAGKKNTRQDVLAYLSIVMLILCVAADIWMALTSDMNDIGIQAAFALLNMVTGGVLKQVNDVYGYDFGGSKGSTDKGDTISATLQALTSRKRAGE